jgi:Uma2 family endonuclease
VPNALPPQTRNFICEPAGNPLTAQQQEAFPPLCPDFIVEVRSRTDARRILEAKMQSWIDNRARLPWLVGPIAKNVMIDRPGRAPEAHEHPEAIRGEGPVSTFELACSPLWPNP